MNIDETIKALRDKLTSNGTIALDADGVDYILGMIERMGNLVEKYECEVIPDYHKLSEQIQAKVKRMGIIIDKYQGEVVPKLNERIEQLTAENEQLKANQPVKGEWLNFTNDFSTAECDKCGEVYEVAPDEDSCEDYFKAFKQSYNFCPKCGADMRGEENERD